MLRAACSSGERLDIWSTKPYGSSASSGSVVHPISSSSLIPATVSPAWVVNNKRMAQPRWVSI